MNKKEAGKIFCENLNLLNKSMEWLLKSYKKAKNIDLNKILNENEIEIMETFSNRFGRTIDIFINKTLRSLDVLELEDISRKLDIVIRAEKRGFVDSYDILIEMKDLRNELAYEYVQDNLIEKFKEIAEKTPTLIKIIDKLNQYAQKMRYC